MLNPWHICGPNCYWWAGTEQDGDWCNRMYGEACKADTGRRGCFYWLCVACGGEWDMLNEKTQRMKGHDHCFKKSATKKASPKRSLIALVK